MPNVYLKNFEHLKKEILTKEKCVFVGSQTSAVIPFNILNNYKFIRFETLEKKIELQKDLSVAVSGAVTWEDLRSFLNQNKRDLVFWPTDISALVLSGVATSATGERSFSFGGFRENTLGIEFVDYRGELVKLKQNKNINDIFSDELEVLINYQKDSIEYDRFKNAPFPIFRNETDLMIGSEGQLGAIWKVCLKTIALKPTIYLLIPFFEKWENGGEHLINIVSKCELHKDIIFAVEFMDRNSLKFVAQSRLHEDSDYLVLEVLEDELDKVLDICLSDFDTSDILTLSSAQFFNIRVSIPREIGEYLTRNKLSKKGTDIEVKGHTFLELIKIYTKFKEKFPNSCLFGHLGNFHLHFNFIYRDEENEQIELMLKELYSHCLKLKASPFAEHGIGLVKQKFIKPFLRESHYKMYKTLKNKFDPHNQFFPDGFMNI